MPKPNWDFCGWVTKNDIQCSDGVIIKHGAFIGQNNTRVPMVWNHNHSDPTNVIGHMLLQNRREGVYGYGFFNDTYKAKEAKKSVQHGDIVAMSIAANKVKKAANGRDVIHGNIYEVSLVYAGANPGALIENVIMHGDDTDEHIIFYPGTLLHSATYPEDFYEEETMRYNQGFMHSGDEAAAQELANALSPEALSAIYDYAREQVGDDVPDEELMEHLTEEELDVIADIVEEDLAEAEEEYYDEEVDPEDIEEEYYDDVDEEPEEFAEEDDEVRQNAFSVGMYGENDMLQHAATADSILAMAQNNQCKLSEAMLEHGVSTTVEDFMMGYHDYTDAQLMHGVTTVDDLITVEPFTDAPGFIRPERADVVDTILASVKTTPMRTVKGRWADLTTEDARAKGYIKGNEKIEEKFGTLQRRTHPQTIYKKQSIDNDDLIDITWDMVAWLKQDMREMWRYELARSIFIPDGRPVSSPDKIKEDHIRPITTDDPLFVTKVGSVTAKNFLEKCITAMATDYKGTGTPDAYADRVLIAQIRLLKTKDEKFLWGDRPLSKADLADLCGVNKFVEPDFLLNTGKIIVVNLKDYEVAAPAKGKSQSYEDFDIDFNKHKYLIEGRCAGALVTPKSALVFTPEEISEVSYVQTEVADEAAFKAGEFYVYFAGVYTKAPLFNKNYVYYKKETTVQS